jgi:DNA-binding LytR/AlgR family response regulator
MNILIVEDEILIADMLERYLKKKGYQVVGKAISYEESRTVLEEKQVDLALLDIRLSTSKTGIDLAKYIQKQYPETSYIFLTSQADHENIEAAKITQPLSYLTKPIQKESLYASIEIGMYNKTQLQKNKHLSVQLGGQGQMIEIKDILFLEASHVYVKIYMKNEQQPLLVRNSLKELKDRLPENSFENPHRSFLVNLDQIKSWDRNFLYLEGHQIPISRARKDSLVKILEERTSF